MIKVLELFAGIGAFTQALKRLDIEHEIVDAVEIDKYAMKSYNAINGTDFETQDVSEWDKDIEVDFIMHGSPCQDFSVAGRQLGGEQGSGTRSSLLWHSVRIIEKLKPKYVLWENVKNVTGKKHRHVFDKYLETLEQIGYRNYWQILNAKDYGIPQNRERVFVLSIRNDIDIDYEFPKPFPLDKKLADMLEDEVDEKYYINNEKANRLILDLIERGEIDGAGKLGNIYGFAGGNFAGNVYSAKGIAPALKTMQGGNRQPLIVVKMRNEMSKYRIRKLTPKETWRLMGFPDEAFEKAEAVNSNSQLYKEAGNSIVVDCLVHILKNLKLEVEHE